MFKKIVLVPLILGCFFTNNDVFSALEEVKENLECQDIGINIVGNAKGIVGFSEEYSVKSSTGSIENANITFALERDNKEVEKTQGTKYVRIFNKSGDVFIKTEIKIGECLYTQKKQVHIYEQSFLYIGNQIEPIETNFTDFFVKKNTLFSTFNSKNTGLDIHTTEGASKFVNLHFDDVNKAKILFIDESASINLLDSLLKAQKTQKNFSFEGKEIFIITSRNYSFLSKVLAPYISQMNIKKVGFIRVDNFLDSINNILLNNLGNITYTSFTKESNFFSLNTFLRYLTYSGLELSFLGLFLSITLAILIVNFSKQFIGLNAFGVYYPILLALCLSLLNVYFVGVFFIIGFISIYIIALISKKIHLLYYSKRSLLMTLFIILTLIFLGIDNYFNLGIIDISTFSNKFILFPFIFLLLVADKVLHEEVQIFSRKGMIYFGELIIITFFSYFVINSSNIQYFLLSYPDLVFVIFLLNILVGRYTGLQLMEIVRFNPLLKKLSEEE